MRQVKTRLSRNRMVIIRFMAVAAMPAAFVSAFQPNGSFLRPLCHQETASSLRSAADADIDTAVIAKPAATSRVAVSKPAIHYTVPGFKVGWQDDDGNWFDEDGPRDGPPRNYWRQSADEREYSEAMNAVDAVLTEYDVETKVSSLERKNSARRPSLSRKILGRWAPLLLSNERVVVNDEPADYDGPVEVPFLIDISRTNGRRFGPKNHYGVFDLMLQKGEELTISTAGAGVCDISTNILANEENESMDIGAVASEDDTAFRLKFGGITYIGDYVMIQRSPDDGAIDFYLRVDKSYLGATKEELEKYHLI